MDGVRSVSVGVLVDVGPKDEQPSERGYAHLLEHMLFQGTGDRDASAIAEMMEIGGGAMGAFTAREYTVYHATVLDEYLPFALEALGDMLCNSVLPEDALDTQRSVILNEIAGHADPPELANNLLKAALWPDHPLGYPTIGLESTLRQATRPTLLDFMQRHYTAPRVILVAAGNVDHASFADQARDNFWPLENSAALSSSSAPQTRLHTVVVKPRDLQQVYFTLAWPAPAYADPARYAWHVFAAMLGGGPTSRLYRRLREDLGMVYHVAAQYQAYGRIGALTVEGATLPQTLVPTLANATIELMKMSDDELNPDDHHRAVQSLISQHLISGDSAYVRMSRRALQEFYFRDPVPSQNVITGLRSQSLEAVQQVAQQTCHVGLPTLALVGPVSDPLLRAVVDMLADFGGSSPAVHMVSSSDPEIDVVSEAVVSPKAV